MIYIIGRNDINDKKICVRQMDHFGPENGTSS